MPLKNLVPKQFENTMKYKVKFVREYEVEAKDKEGAEAEGINCLQSSMENGNVFPDKVTRIKEIRKVSQTKENKKEL